MSAMCLTGDQLAAKARGLALTHAGMPETSDQWPVYVQTCEAWRTHRNECGVCQARYPGSPTQRSKAAAALLGLAMIVPTLTPRAVPFPVVTPPANCIIAREPCPPLPPGPTAAGEYSDRLGVVLLGNETNVGREKAAHVGTWVVRIICTTPVKCGVQAAHYAAAERYGVRLVLGARRFAQTRVGLARVVRRNGGCAVTEYSRGGNYRGAE